MTQATITLRALTAESAGAIMKLSVSAKQTHFVANNTRSIAQAYFEKYHWMRGIYADDEPVGFIMLYDNPDEPTYFLWRLMIDQQYQGNKYGKTAVQLLIDYTKTRPNATELLVSYVPGEGSPQKFYENIGFVDTGKEDHGEKILSLKLTVDK